MFGIEAELARGCFEECVDRLGVWAFAAAALAEGGVVELTAARVLDAPDDLVGARGERGAKPLFEDFFHRAGEPKEDGAGEACAGFARRLEGARHVFVAEAGNNGR